MPSRKIAALSVESIPSEEETVGPQEEIVAAIDGLSNEPAELNADKLDRDEANRGEKTLNKSLSFLEYFHKFVCLY